ncbi:MAG: sigma-70 family RNA polymerase sigma factor [Chitinophagales bacterium]|nr:sigma-70 family RNA polymerase sigma factor [Chitinophagales bacterium]MCO5279745.1 sigma-70 family RNA polymerase sigma factor [Chitinophagales bacterium]HRN93248.1 sigma-70 family RNA polymerase sigma factor [Chitinophagales bacterium]HRP40300.1 sigma-70 family RNA polymerase sigma factor [Chitinophagales bacterium]
MELNSKFSPRAKEDMELVVLAQQGNQQSFAKLMERYRDSIYFMVLKMVHNRDDAEDLTQEAFSKAFNSLSNYSAEYAFSTWLFKIATNNCIDFIRKKRLQTTSLDSSTITNEEGESPTIAVADYNPNPEQSIIKEQRAARIREVIEKLSPKYKQLIEMRYFDELSYEEIAAQLDLPLGTVKAQLFRAKDLLFNLLKSTQAKY